MAPKPYFERVPEPVNFKPLTDDLPEGQLVHGAPEETPSPRSPSTLGSLSPPPLRTGILPTAIQTTLMPVTSEDGIPFDHTLPHFIVSILFKLLPRLGLELHVYTVVGR